MTLNPELLRVVGGVLLVFAFWTVLFTDTKSRRQL